MTTERALLALYDFDSPSVSTPDQHLGELPRPAEHQLEPLRREAPLVGEFERQFALLGGLVGAEPQDG